MRDVKIPNWLDELPLAPEFHPTDTEFADPIAYISKIEKEASAFGICKVIPPLPRPSKKYVLANLNKSLLKCPELGNDVKLSNGEKLGENRAVFTTRHQELGHSNGKRTKGVGVGASQPPITAAHKQVWQSGEVYTLEQFESKSKTFGRSQLGMVKDVSPLVIEALFWKATCEKPIYIEYANDVPGSGFGEPVGSSRFVHRRRRRRRAFQRNDQESSAIREEFDDKNNDYDCQKGEPTRYSPSSSVDMLKKDACSLNMFSDRDSGQRDLNTGNEMEGSSGWKLSNSPWNLQVIARSPGSLTRFMPDDIPGVTSPMVYIGMLFSWFAWHVEDHELHSLNFLHMGSPKTWYAVPGDYAFTFEEVIRSKAYGGGTDRLAALTLLGQKTTLLSPETVVGSGIPCCRLVQNPGEFVVTFPRAYHIGFSHGFNCGEAANFGTPKWLEVAKEAAVRRAAMNFLPMLSHQQLLYLLTMSFISRVPRSLLPGVRSSRLRDRQKEERELLVNKEFVEDILNENKLLTCLLQRKSSYRAVLWDLKSLQPSLSNIAIEIVKNQIENVDIENDNNLDTFSQMSLDNETLLLMEDDDMSSDFQVDSGSLPCVACGVLGFPFMAVIQPSAKASMDNICMNDRKCVRDLGVKESRVSTAVSGGGNNNGKDIICSDLPNISDPIMESSRMNVDEGWNTTNGYLRPRIFCLEHASKIEELLDPNGGAKLLIICHSDFQKIKAQAAAIAEQIGSKFRYNEVQLENATQDELNLINLAIDNEQDDHSVQDWTLELNVNLRQSVNRRNKSSSEKIQHALTLDALFSDTSPTTIPISPAVILQWHARKSRSNRKSNRKSNRVIAEPSNTISVETDVVSKAKSFDAQIPRKEAKLIQYSRRLKSNPQNPLTHIGKYTKENGSFVLGDLHQEKQIGEVSILSQVTEEALATAPLVENVEAQDVEQGREKSTDSVTCASQSIEDSESEKDDKMKNETSDLVTENGSEEQANEDDEMDSKDHKNDENNPVSSSFTPSRSKRRREVELQREERFDFDGFIRSPCERLRPRGGKDADKSGFIEKTKNTMKKPAKKKAKASNVKIQKKDDNKGTHRCDQEGCKLSFRTKTELNLHRKNKCPHCGKTFSSHKYAILHFRVHEDDRPLKCSWKGCKMTFKWAWARTEHLRVHTGERPYKCKFEGCDRTFRFVSDFSRHRRKTGHYVNQQA